jgi:hypothetical protein
MAIDNDPSAEHPLDATGFLSEDVFNTLLAALATAGAQDWMVGYWDGWSGIEPALKEGYGDRLFRLQLPLRNYLAVQTGLSELANVRPARHVFIGPSLMAPLDRSVLIVGDVDWPVTYVGFKSRALRRSIARTLQDHGISAETSCSPLDPLPGYSSTAHPSAASP